VLMAQTTEAAPYRRILFAVDYSPAADAAARFLVSLAPALGSMVQVLHVFRAPETDLLVQAGTGMSFIQTVIAKQKAKAARQLKAWLARNGPEAWRADVRLATEGVAPAILAAAAADQPDLIVLGAHAKKGIARAVLGSVAHDVLRDTNLDVLVVPPALGS